MDQKMKQFLHRFVTPKVQVADLTMYHGQVIGSADDLERCLPDGFTSRLDWCDSPDLRVWVGPAERAIITFCEGVLSVQIFHNQWSFWREVASQAEFYLQHVAAVQAKPLQAVVG